MENSTPDSYSLPLHIKAALIKDMPFCAMALLLVLSFKWADAVLVQMGAPLWFGPVHVLLYWTALSWLIFRQLYKFRQAVREMLVTRILNREFWLARWLMERYTFLGILAILTSLATAASLSGPPSVLAQWGGGAFFVAALMGAWVLALG